ncbi:Na+/H+ antiporter family protein [Aquisalibacillus elongatus]|uniref:Sodium:proton antiporter n=1 Tax=Aquisalibacillus elongatus TaxID=485577 RepID=A0A3N5B055_9BACI|nr:SLC13 family permease [Aquisalibacillus elongatus]RPF50569.1 hypothetical protein EDC24_2536 [Aquisalibacillus elongatus]
MASAVIVSVLILTILSLLKINVLVAIIVSAFSAGLIAQESLSNIVKFFVESMGGSSETAISYILLGGFAAAISMTGITKGIVQFLRKIVRGKRGIMLLAIAAIASLSQNAVPVHIAFIPILIPPLIALFDKMQIDRRAIAASLTFGLKAPYVMLPLGFGLLFHEIIQENLREEGIYLSVWETASAMLIPGLGMVVGLLIAIFITYRKNRDYGQVQPEGQPSEFAQVDDTPFKFELKHVMTLIAIVAALIVQILTGQMILGALTGLLLMFLLVAVPYKQMEGIMSSGIAMMGMIAFIMLAASGYAGVLKETGSVEALVNVSSDLMGDQKPLIALVLLAVGLIVTIGIGTSFGTIPILAALFIPIATQAGFSPLAIAALIGTAGALGDAGSPASDSTLGPTAGLNVDGKHNHIWDTVVPTFIHFNIPLLIFGWAASLIL